MFVAALDEPLDHVDLVLGLGAKRLGFGASDVGFLESFDFHDTAELLRIGGGLDSSAFHGFAVAGGLPALLGRLELGRPVMAGDVVSLANDSLLFFFDGFVEFLQAVDVLFCEHGHVNRLGE